MIKPKPVQPAVAGGFTIDDFTVDEQAGAVTCPAGVTRLHHAHPQCHLRRRLRQLPAARALHHLQVRARPLACTRTMACCALPAPRGPPTPGCARDYATHRPNVERTVAQVATYRGRRIKLRYRGVTKNNAWLKRRTAALNLRNLLGRGLTRHDGAWVLAT